MRTRTLAAGSRLPRCATRPGAGPPRAPHGTQAVGPACMPSLRAGECLRGSGTVCAPPHSAHSGAARQARTPHTQRCKGRSWMELTWRAPPGEARNRQVAHPAAAWSTPCARQTAGSTRRGGQEAASEQQGSTMFRTKSMTGKARAGRGRRRACARILPARKRPAWATRRLLHLPSRRELAANFPQAASSGARRHKPGLPMVQPASAPEEEPRSLQYSPCSYSCRVRL